MVSMQVSSEPMQTPINPTVPRRAEASQCKFASSGYSLLPSEFLINGIACQSKNQQSLQKRQIEIFKQTGVKTFSQDKMLNLEFSLFWVGILLKPAHRSQPWGYGVPFVSIVSFFFFQPVVILNCNRKKKDFFSNGLPETQFSKLRCLCRLDEDYIERFLE